MEGVLKQQIQRCHTKNIKSEAGGSCIQKMSLFLRLPLMNSSFHSLIFCQIKQAKQLRESQLNAVALVHQI